MSLLNYWPSLDEINKCIKAEAENASDEVLLAVHQQFPLAYLTVGPDGMVMPESRTVATEEDILNYFTGHAPSGSHVLPITGASGVGKSHLIRILDARLRRLPDAHRYLIIRIPKSASLRRVVELILEAEPLNDKKFDQVKVEFTKALADLSMDEAVIHFEAHLEIELKKYAALLKVSLNRETTNTVIKERLFHADKLPMLMTDPETVEHFRAKVLPRIIQRSVRGVTFDEGEVNEIDSTSAQFNVDDLDLNGVDLGQANQKVANYYRTGLASREGLGKAIAVNVLNEVVDQATSQLYQLNQSLGGMTLAEVILEIRRLLLVDSRELVILVEDFAALVGIQDTLAKVLIQEGETSKGKEFATIRSAIAVTDGYLARTHTLATRAGREWVVESRLESEIEILRRTKSLVASYLNAARFGEVGLKAHYNQAVGGVASGGAIQSLPLYSDGDEDVDKTLDAFGRFEGKVPLFPFTESAIECLAHLSLTSGNALVFNPRWVIKHIIRELLTTGREAFVTKQFPPPSISLKKPSADVAQWLSALEISDDQRKRYERLVTVWGNDPKMRSDIGHIPREVFEAFGLPQPKIDYIPPSPKPTTLGRNLEKIVATDVTPRQELDVKKYQDALENWVQNGVKLEMAIANDIRKHLGSLINDRIDWNAERCLKRKLPKFSIPNAVGEGNFTANNVIKIAQNCDDPDGRLRSELTALLRYFVVYKDASDYSGVDDDIARIANLADRLLPSTLDWIRAKVKLQNQSAILALASNSRLLGLNARVNSLGEVSSFLFGTVDIIEVLPESAPDTFREWKSLQTSAKQIRQKLQLLLLETNGCYQGIGATPLGIDIVRLLTDYPDDEAKIEFESFDVLDAELSQSMRNMSDARVSIRLNQVLQDARRIQKLIIEDLGIDIDKQVVANAFKELAETLREMGVWSDADIGITPNVFVTLCEEFRSAAVKDCLSILQGFEEAGGEEKSTPKKIARGANLPLIPLLTTERFLRSADKVIQAAETHAQDLESKYDGVNPSESAKEIARLFDEIVKNLNILQVGEP